MLEILTDSL